MPPTVDQTSPAFYDATSERAPNPSRVTQEQSEAGIGSGQSPAGSGNRLTQIPVEVATAGNPKARLTQVAIEIAIKNTIALQLLAFDDDASQQFKTPSYSLPSTGANIDEGVELPLQQIYEVVFTST